jgi:6-phosphogluconolactonase (cycloisomerase 2 family)
MRNLRALLAVVVALNVLGWALPAATVSGATPGAGVSGPVSPAAGATIQVTTETDQLDDSSLPASATSGCSLREALLLAFENGDRGCGPTTPAATNITIKVPPGDYVLTINDDLPPIADGKVINISGPGVVIDGGSQGGRRLGIFHIVNGGLNLSSLTLQHGSRAVGGAIWLDSGTVTADQVRFDSNDAAYDPALDDEGGAIISYSGDLTVTNSLFVNNLAYKKAGAVSTDLGYFFKDKFVGNQAGAGGAFGVSGPTTDGVMITDSEFKANKARPADFEVPGSGYQPYNDQHGGGAISNYGKLQVYRTLFENNRSELNHGGGAVENHGSLLMAECVLAHNTAVANGPGDSNANISYAWGGAILNYSQLDLVRCSIHENQADYAGAIFNHGTGALGLYNSTVSNNTAAIFYGGLMNDHALFGNTSGATMNLTNSTIGKNNSGGVGPSGNLLFSVNDFAVVFANTILDAGCSGTQFTMGRSIMTDFCDTTPDTLVDPSATTDISNTTQTQLGLQPLTAGNSQVPEFMVQRIDGNSIAAAFGRNDQFGCAQTYINHLDQNLAPRAMAPAPCSSGAIEAVSPPPQFSSNPAPGLIRFPLIDFTQGQGGSLATLVLHNLGGGALTYQLVDQGGSSAIVNDSGATAQGTLFTNQQATITFACNPAVPGEYWRDFTVTTSDPNRPQANFSLVCDAVGPMGLPGMDQMPGPVPMPMPLPGQTAHTGVTMTNLGHMPVTTSPALGEMGPPWMQTVTAAPAGQAPASPATTLNPGQSLHVDVACTPTGPGVFLNTLTFTTNDPVNPVIQYNLSCEGQVTSPPEPLSTASAYTPKPAAHVYGVAVSPDGNQVLGGGGGGEATLSAFVRDPSTGALTQNGWVALPGMSAIQSIKYSHDGQYVYYTSAEGNGIVAINSAGDSLGASQVITSGTSDNICLVNHFPVFCPNNVMHGADGLAVSPDDQFVYVVGYYDNSLTTFQRQPNGQLGLYQIITGTVNGLSGPVKLVTSPDGNDVYVASFNSNTVAVFQRTGTGVLGFQAAYQNGSGGLTQLSQPSDLVVSPDGNFLYVAASGSNAVDVFQRSSGDGGLSLSSVLTGVTGAWGLAITHDDAGRRLFVTTQNANQVQVFGRDQTTGALSFVGANTVTDPVFVTSSPDDLDVYASLYSQSALQHFQTVRNAPVLSHISPASAVVGGSAFTLSAGGGRFYPGSQIVWGGTPLATTFVSAQTLQAAVPAGLINALGTVQVKVRNSGPGGGDSTTQPFAIISPAQPPVPSIANLVPPAASFGGGDLTVLVQGANFAPDAAVYYNQVAVPTLFINDHTLQNTLSADILNTPGDGGLEVTNGGAAPALSALAAPSMAATSSRSTVVSFRVNRPGVPAAPALASLAPASVVSGSAAIWVTLTGYNFSAGAPAQSVGRWNGSVRPSTVLDGHTLLMELTQADLAQAGNGLVTVITPGFGASLPVKFRVRLPGENPIPVVTGDTPSGWTLYVRGSDFVSGAQVSLNGAPRATTFINQYEVKTTLNPADRGVVITVSNPGPGGGPSNNLVAFLARVFLPLIRR